MGHVGQAACDGPWNAHAMHGAAHEIARNVSCARPAGISHEAVPSAPPAAPHGMGMTTACPRLRVGAGRLRGRL